MYLKKITAQGFKSFADLTTFELDKGITGVVGPNGSGKSNVVDAVKWVLGEQSVKSLRGTDSMTDVIFSGSKTRKYSNIATVSLYFNNEDRYMNVDADEFSIKRKLYSDGTNEYFLNNNQCRLKDITEILLDSGIAKESFNIISQGKIDEILTTKALDRRVVFEEAAGVLKYKKRKEESLRKLEKAKINISRVTDIIEEIKLQIEPLKIEAEKAIKYNEINKELKTKDIALTAKLIKTAGNRLKEIKSEKETLIDEIQKNELSDNVFEKETLENKLKMDHITKNIDLMTGELLQKTKHLEELNSKKAILLEKEKHEPTNTSDIVELEENIKILENKTKLLEKQLEEAKNNQENLLDETREINQLEEVSFDRRRKVEIDLAGLTREYTYLENQIERIEYSIENNSLVPSAVSYLLKNKINGLIDTVGNVIKVDNKFNTAISTTLGYQTNNIIVKTPDVARDGINILKQRSLGRVTFMPLTTIKSKTINISDVVKSAPGFIDIAINLVQFDSKYDAAIRNLLGNIIIVDSLENANKIAKLINYTSRIVTLEGEVINAFGSITGGQNKVKNTLTEQIELEKTKEKLKSKDKLIKNSEIEINKLDEETTKLEKRKKQISVELYNLNIDSKEIELYKLNKQLDLLNTNLRTTSKDAIKEEIKTVIDEYYKQEQVINEINFNITKLKKEKEELMNTVDNNAYIHKEKTKKLTNLKEQLKKYEIEETKLEINLDNYLNYLSETYEITYEFASLNYVLEEEEDIVKKKVIELKREIKNLGFVNLEAPEKYQELDKRYKFYTEEEKNILDSIEYLENVISELDILMEKEFVKSFNEIQTHFQKIFVELFGGGTAFLKLTDKERPLESGIDIIVQPPGKKLNSINLLSGGEKTFTAISLLFAIINSRRVPFCIFDEVEAALDEVNVVAFSKYLLKLKEKTQFIVITHKKKTMEYVDVLYGITMQEEGISKLVSVKLKDL